MQEKSRYIHGTKALQVKHDVLLAEGAQDGQEGEAAVGDAASPRSRATKRRVLAAA